MNKLLRQLILSFVVTLCATPLFADGLASVPKYNFVVWLYDGGKVSFSLDEHPVVTHSNGTFIVSAAESRVEYAHSSVRKFTIEEVEEVPEEPTPDPEPTPEAEFYFVVWLHNGARIAFPFAEHPRLTYSDGDIVITTVKEQLIYPHIDVRKFTLTDEDISQDESENIDVVEHEAQWHRQGDVMLFSDCTPGESVIIYDAQGHLLYQYTIASDGTLQIPLHSFAEGVYIVKIESITYKFIKK